MKKIFKNLSIFTVLYLLSTNFLYAAKGTGLATIYIMNVNKIELCETGSSTSICVNPVTVSKPSLATDIDLAGISAGAAAATLGNFGLAKTGVTYDFIQVTMSRLIKIKGSASDGTTTCFTKGNGNLDGTMGIATTTSGQSTVADLFVPPFVDPTDFPDLNSVADADGSSPRISGTINAADSHFQARQPLSKPFTLDPSAIPTVKIAFGTATALTVNEAAGCNTAAQMHASPPDSTVTIQGQ